MEISVDSFLTLFSIFRFLSHFLSASFSCFFVLSCQSCLCEGLRLLLYFCYCSLSSFVLESCVMNKLTEHFL